MSVLVALNSVLNTVVMVCRYLAIVFFVSNKIFLFDSLLISLVPLFYKTEPDSESFRVITVDQSKERNVERGSERERFCFVAE